MSGARQCWQYRSVCGDHKQTRPATRCCALALCESEWFAHTRTVLHRARPLAYCPCSLCESDDTLDCLSSAACLPLRQWPDTRTCKHEQASQTAPVLQRDEDWLHRRRWQMFDREWHAARQRCDCCCAGRELQQ